MSPQKYLEDFDIHSPQDQGCLVEDIYGWRKWVTGLLNQLKEHVEDMQRQVDMIQDTVAVLTTSVVTRED